MKLSTTIFIVSMATIAIAIPTSETITKHCLNTCFSEQKGHFTGIDENGCATNLAGFVNCTIAYPIDIVPQQLACRRLCDHCVISNCAEDYCPTDGPYTEVCSDKNHPQLATKFPLLVQELTAGVLETSIDIPQESFLLSELLTTSPLHLPLPKFLSLSLLLAQEVPSLPRLSVLELPLLEPQPSILQVL
ncbi:hypothetical protein BT63DRAFT_273107 [Microthyrium microscopicum]|uniref:Extracellular membrane protein CFEM domain-containing protein n=1 Tax=Microthyrium microscopicum TaxID=703497 RepID=A0A6A6UBL5_9PEZI|nr:hypothetical protein BT63DRAFT_273107 [Microthyrium microscopicum]